MTATWVFGYGSLVSPASLGATLGRQMRPGDDFLRATLSGWGRRWNYGVAHTVGHWTDATGRVHERTIVALGIAAGAAEVADGVVARVDEAELARLDRRERDYDRVDVTATTTVEGDFDGVVVTYVPRPTAVARYVEARDAGRAAIEQRYWDLVDGAFAAFGEAARRRYHDTTPVPDVPVLTLVRQARELPSDRNR